MAFEPQFIKFPTTAAAKMAANDESIHYAESRLIEGKISRQGGRWRFSATVTNSDLVWLSKMAKQNTKVGRPVNRHVNRDEEASHKASILQYLAQEPNYILGNYTFNIASQTKVFSSDTQTAVLTAYMLITRDTELYITDGLHRSSSLVDALSINAKIADDGADISFMFENEFSKIQQDFADLASTLRISESMVQHYNPRLPIFQPSAKVRSEVPLLADRVDFKEKQLSVKSPKLFTLAVFNTALAGIVVGRPDLDKNSMNKLLLTAFTDDNEKELWTERMVRFFKVFATTNPNWRDVTASANPQFIVEKRNDDITLNPTGLKIICAASHYIFRLKTVDGKDDIVAQETAIKKLARLSYSRTKEQFWQDHGVIATTSAESKVAGKFVPSFGPMRAVIKPLLAQCDLEHLYEAEIAEKKRRGRPLKTDFVDTLFKQAV